MNGLYLCRPGGAIIGIMSGLDENTAMLKRQVNQPWEISFDVYRYLPVKSNEWAETTYYHSLSEGMELFLDTEKIKARFVIDSEPSSSCDGINEHKSVIAHSIECELQKKFIKDAKINTGLPESLENLVIGSITRVPIETGDTDTEQFNYNINPYTTLPVDYIRNFDDFDEILTSKYVFTNSTGGTGVNTIYWAEKNITIPYTVNENTGEMIASSTTQTQDLIDCLTAFIQDMPRIQQNIIWAKDENHIAEGVRSDDGDEVCVVDCYIKYLNDSFYIAPPVYTISENSDGTREITAKTNLGSYVFTNTRLADGISDLREFYTDFASQLNVMDIALENVKISGWSMGTIEDIDNSRPTFTIDNQDVYSFLTNTFASYKKIAVDFDRNAKKVNLINITDDDETHDTGIVIGFHNLVNSIDIQTTSDDGIITQFNVSGADDLGIYYANFGNNQIINLDYFMSKIDQYGNRQFVTDDLYNHYQNWKKTRDEDTKVYSVATYSYNKRTKTFISGNRRTISGTTRKVYMELSKLYNQTLVDIAEMKNLVPNDGVRTDYTTYGYEDLKTYWYAYLSAFDALIELYKADYGADEIGYYNPDTGIMAALRPWLNISDRFEKEYVKGYKISNGTYVEVTSILDTIYSHDFISYYYNIIPNVLLGLKKYIQTSQDLETVVTDSNGNWIYLSAGNPYYQATPQLFDNLALSAYKYDMSLYGKDELTALLKSWVNAASKIYRVEFIKSGTTLEDYEYNSYSDLTESQQKNFMGQSDYDEKLNRYLDYTSTTKRPNKLISESAYGVTFAKYNDEYRVSSVGIIFLAQAEIEKCENLIEAIQEKQETYETMRKEIVSEVTLENWDEFSDEELGIISSLIKNADYSNDNILITSLDNIEGTVVDVQKELLDDANKKLFEKSRPQYSFTVTLDNLLALSEFEPLHSSIELLNYIYLRIGLRDNETIRLRIVTIENNPLIDSEDFTLGFSNLTYGINGLSDLVYLIEELAGGSSSSGSVSGGSSGGGTYGTTDANITMSNNMLNALLKNREYEASLNDTIITTQKLITDSLYAGEVVIGGYTTDGELENGLKVTEDGLIVKFTNMEDYYEYDSAGNLYDISIRCSGEPDPYIFPPSEHNDEYYLDKQTGKLYQSNGSKWVDTGIVLTKASAYLKYTADGLTSEVTRAKGAEGTLSTTITQTAAEIRSEVKDTTDGLSSQITQNANSISSEVSRAKDAENTLSTTITQTATEIRSEVKDTTDGLSSQITQNANSISSEVSRAKGAEGTLSSTITQTAESIRAEVSDVENGLQSSINTEAGRITSEVKRAKNAESSLSDNIDTLSDDIDTMSSKIEQKPESISLSVTNGEKTAGLKITLKDEKGSTVDTTSGNIAMTGVVSFTDLSGSGTTTINGSNITTGTIDASVVSVTNINAGNIKTGKLSADRIDASSITISSLDDDIGTVVEEQYIYRSSSASSFSKYTTWVTKADNTAQNVWNTVRPKYNASYPNLFIAKQKKTLDGTITCTTPVIDQTTTVIDGGHITTGTISANRIDTASIKISSLNNDEDFQTAEEVSDAVSNGVSGKANKTDAVAEEQYIYYNKSSASTTPTTPTDWISDYEDASNKWVMRRPTYDSSNPILFISKQRKTVSGAITCTTPIVDKTTTIIDGSNITTGTIKSNNGYSWLNLNDNKFHFGGSSSGYLDWNGSTFAISAANLKTSDSLKYNGISVNGQEYTNYTISDGHNYNVRILRMPGFVIINGSLSIYGSSPGRNIPVLENLPPATMESSNLAYYDADETGAFSFIKLYINNNGTTLYATFDDYGNYNDDAINICSFIYPTI